MGGSGRSAAAAVDDYKLTERFAREERNRKGLLEDSPKEGDNDNFDSNPQGARKREWRRRRKHKGFTPGRTGLGRMEDGGMLPRRPARWPPRRERQIATCWEQHAMEDVHSKWQGRLSLHLRVSLFLSPVREDPWKRLDREATNAAHLN